jgi:hypothetical protein
MHAKVRDTVLAPGAPRVRASVANTRTFKDAHGYRIRISSDVRGLDLATYAGVLAGIPLHGREIEKVAVQVVAPSKIGAICGSEDALACYGADSPGRSQAGHMFIPSADRDLVHIITHEYGHHMDNQQLNLAGVDFGCGADSDGSRRWFFARDLEDKILSRGFDCSAATAWNHLLPELYAEDFARANGMTGWQMSVPPPSNTVIAALQADVLRPFRRQSSQLRISVPRRGAVSRKFTVTHWTALGVRLKVPRGRDYDLFLYKAGQRRPLIKSTRSGSADERIGGAFIGPGSYKLVVRSRAGAGSSRLKLAFR